MVLIYADVTVVTGVAAAAGSFARDFPAEDSPQGGSPDFIFILSTMGCHAEAAITSTDTADAATDMAVAMTRATETGILLPAETTLLRAGTAGPEHGI